MRRGRVLPSRTCRAVRGRGGRGRSRHGASVKGATWHEAAAKADAGESQIRTVLGASCQKTRECVLVAVGECSNDAHGVTTATSKCAAEEPAGGCETCPLDFARTRAIYGSNNTEPAGKPAACAPPARLRPCRAFRARFALRAHVTCSLPLRFALVSLRLKLC